MIDDVRHGQTEPDIQTPSPPLVTLDVVSGLFIAAGLPRSMRTLQRYCMNGTLDCVKEATNTGDTYFVAEPSIARAIVSLRQLHEAKGVHRHAATEDAMSGHDAPRHEPTSLDDTDGHGPTLSDNVAQQSMARLSPTNADMSGYVAQLEARLGEKDEEIDFLREELIDRRGQIRDMKGIIDGQNQLLETIQSNVAPIFKALAATVQSNKISFASHHDGAENRFEDGEPKDYDGQSRIGGSQTGQDANVDSVSL